MIESTFYNKIIDVLPIVCVDGFIVEDSKILLLKRKNYPAVDEWWVPGGRVLKNEILKDAILRKIKEETQLSINIVNQIGVSETIFDKKHTINICYLLEISDSSGQVNIDSDHSEYKWFPIENLPKDLNTELVSIVEVIKKNIKNGRSN